MPLTHLIRYSLLEVEKILSPKIEILQVAHFWKSLGYNPRDFPHVDKHVKNAGIDTMEPMNDKVFSSCLNTLSTHVRTKLGLGKCQQIWSALFPHHIRR